MNRIHKTITMAIVLLCLNTNVFAEDEIYTSITETWILDSDDLHIFSSGSIYDTDVAINAVGSVFYIVNAGNIYSNIIAIDATNMSGYIANYGNLWERIISTDMTGDIYNYGGGVIQSVGSAIITNAMTGDIYNYAGAYIDALHSAIDAEFMLGDIYNEGILSGEIYGINATDMEGNIYNSGSILGDDEGIFAEFMIGDIYNYADSLIASSTRGIRSYAMTGNIYNTGKITGDESAGIYSTVMFGNIYNYSGGEIEGYMGIESAFMTGSIYNDGTIIGDLAGINAFMMKGDIYNEFEAYIEGGADSGIIAREMTGSIFNYGTIYTYNLTYGAIHAWGMTGDITNGETGIIGSAYIAIDATNLSGNLYNYGTIHGDGVGIISEGMQRDIINYSGASILSENTAIDAESMIGNIVNYGTISTFNGTAIYADKMTGDIENYDSITGVDEGIDARDMEGDIINHSDATISGSYEYGIYALGMKGNIYNSGVIEGYYYHGIEANGMTGSIYNHGLIYSYDYFAINAVAMEGNIYNYADGRIISEDFIPLKLNGFTGTVYNYGLIEAVGNYAAIDSSNDLYLVGNGTIIGNIGGQRSYKLYITNDMDTVLDLSDAPLTNWSEINLLDGEMIITDIVGGFAVVTQTGDDTYVHLGVDNVNVNYYLNEGVLNPYSTEGKYGEVYVGFFSAADNTTVELDFGEGMNDLIIAQLDGGIGAGAILSFIPQEVFEAGWFNYYTFFENIGVSEDVEILLPLFYTLSTEEIEETIVINSHNYYVKIERGIEAYDDYAHIYNKGLASFLVGNEAEAVEDIRIALEKVYTADELNALLEPYNMMAYASLANNNVFWVNNRIGKLFDLLSGTYGSDTSFAYNSGAASSSYATALNSRRLNRDIHGNHIWFDVYMSDTRLDGEIGYESKSKGYEAAIGMDKELNKSTIIGMSFYINEYDTDITGGLPVSVDSEGLGLNAYGQYTKGKMSHKWMLGYTQYENDADRLSASADFDSNEMYAAYRFEYLWDRGSYDLVPILALHYAHITYDDIIESGTNIGLEAYEYDSLQAEIGIKLYKQVGSFTYNCGVSILNELMDTETDATAVSDLGSYSQETIERDDMTFRVTAGIAYKLDDQMTLGLDLAREFGENTGSDSIQLKLTYSF